MLTFDRLRRQYGPWPEPRLLQGFSAGETTLTGDLQEIADTIPLISQAFTDETPAIDGCDFRVHGGCGRH